MPARISETSFLHFEVDKFTKKNQFAGLEKNLKMNTANQTSVIYIATDQLLPLTD